MQTMRNVFRIVNTKYENLFVFYFRVIRAGWSNHAREPIRMAAPSAVLVSMAANWLLLSVRLHALAYLAATVVTPRLPAKL